MNGAALGQLEIIRDQKEYFDEKDIVTNGCDGFDGSACICAKG
jgi:hypothetical protein